MLTLATKCRFITCVTAFTNKPAFFLITLEFVASIQLLNANKYFFSDSLPSHHKFWLVSSKQAGREENYLIQFYMKRKLIKFSVWTLVSVLVRSIISNLASRCQIFCIWEDKSRAIGIFGLSDEISTSMGTKSGLSVSVSLQRRLCNMSIYVE